MKIIKQGKAQPQLFIGMCSKCESVIEADLDEVEASGGDFRTEYRVYWQATCPACRHKMNFSPKEERR